MEKTPKISGSIQYFVSLTCNHSSIQRTQPVMQDRYFVTAAPEIRTLADKCQLSVHGNHFHSGGRARL